MAKGFTSTQNEANDSKKLKLEQLYSCPDAVVTLTRARPVKAEQSESTVKAEVKALILLEPVHITPAC